MNSIDSLPNPVSFEEALSRFVSHLKTQKRSSSTAIAYSSDLSQLKKHLSDKRITQATSVRTEHLEGFINELGSQNYTAKSISRKINSLKTFFKFLKENELITENPSHPLSHPKFETKSPRFLSVSEIKNLRDAVRLDIRIGAIVELLIQTGMRISELANLRLTDFKKNELHIRPLENNPSRNIALSKPAQIALQNYLQLRPQVQSDHIFVTKTGRPLLIRNIRTAIDRYFKKAGIKDAKVNDLRHTFIVQQLKQGVDPKTIHEHVGHRRLTSTQKYLDFVTIDVTETHHRLIEI